MYISVNEKDIELSTKLGTAVELEKKYKLPIMSIFQNLGQATTTELVDIVCIAAKKANTESDIKNELLENWDYMDLFSNVQELVAKMMFSGTDEQNEAKIDKMMFSDEQKNGVRALLGLPKKIIQQQMPESTGNTSSEQVTN